MTEVACYRWQREFGGRKSDQVKRLKALEAENTRLRKAVADRPRQPHKPWRPGRR